MKKLLFVFNIQSLSDIITNSSSELFVFKDKSGVDAVINILNNIYPDWRNEYDDPILVQDADHDSLETFSENLVSTWFDERFPRKGEDPFEVAKSQVPAYRELLQKRLDAANIPLTVEEAIEDFDHAYIRFLDLDWEERQKLNIDWWYPSFTDRFYQEVREHYSNNILLFSIGENPDWNYQEKLMDYANRYHLG